MSAFRVEKSCVELHLRPGTVNRLLRLFSLFRPHPAYSTDSPCSISVLSPVRSAPKCTCIYDLCCICLLRFSVPRRTGYSPGRLEGHYAVRGSLSAVSRFQLVKGGIEVTRPGRTWSGELSVESSLETNRHQSRRSPTLLIGRTDSLTDSRVECVERRWLVTLTGWVPGLPTE